MNNMRFVFSPLLIKMLACLSVCPKSWDDDSLQIRNSRREGVMNGWLYTRARVNSDTGERKPERMSINGDLVEYP